MSTLSSQFRAFKHVVVDIHWEGTKSRQTSISPENTWQHSLRFASICSLATFGEPPLTASFNVYPISRNFLLHATMFSNHSILWVLVQRQSRHPSSPSISFPLKTTTSFLGNIRYMYIYILPLDWILFGFITHQNTVHCHSSRVQFKVQ